MMRISLARILSDLEKGSQADFPQLHFPDFSNESLSRSTTESERRISISRFAQHLCVVYEYQIGFLQGLKAVHSAADYVAEVLIRSIRNGRISSLSSNELTLQLLHDSSSPCSAELEIKRPDIYGYRNLIVLPANAEPSTFFSESVYENTNLNDATIFTNGNSEIGARKQLLVQKIDQSPSSPVRRGDVIKRQQSIKSKSPLLSTSVNLRQHLHRAYRPVFFVIYERPSVIDHLTELRLIDNLTTFQDTQIFSDSTNANEIKLRAVHQCQGDLGCVKKPSNKENTKSLLTVILDFLFQTRKSLYVLPLIFSQQILRVLLAALVDSSMITFLHNCAKYKKILN
ncbi:hypothetical protein TcWFU_006159 [Taenia crassiceps]|uniref:Uncharacterized protein n=1 Tax=Taenia crassiceps TaxID=6207 RepID=A0ABR4QRG5_9CEST